MAALPALFQYFSVSDFSFLARQYTLGPRPTENPQPRRHVGGFSPRQQAIYRPLVDAAWRRVCAREAFTVGGPRIEAFERKKWYREILHQKFGVYTSKQLNKRGDFEQACAAFEEIAGTDIYWQLRVGAAPLERMRRKLNDIIRDHSIDENYIAATSKRMWGTHTSNLNANQLNSVIGELQQHFKRQEAA